MPGRNGLAALPGARRPIKLVAETITYTFELADGETVALAGYRKGPSCPVTVLIAVDDALATLSENEPAAESRDTFTSSRYLASLNYAERTLRREMLMAVLPGLSPEAANILAADGGAWKEILVELGWRQSDEAMEEQEIDQDPEARAGQSTGATDSPASSPATQDVSP
jgi:hypothetical protein